MAQMRDAEPTTNDEAQRYCMSSLFYPATALMVRLRVSRKFMVAGAPALVLLLALGFGLLHSLHQRVRALNVKLVSVALAGDLVELNRALIESRRVAIASPGSEGGGLEGFKKQAALADEKMADVQRDVLAAVPLFDMTAEATELKSGWSDVQNQIQALSANPDFAQKAFAAHAPEYARVYAFLRDLGNKSGLSQDPDTDLSYLGYTLANNTPSTAGITVRIAAYAALNINRGDVSSKDKLFYEVTDARLGDTFGAAETLLSQSMNANPVVNAALAERFTTLKDSSKSMLGFIRTNFTSVDKVAVTQQALTASAAPTIDAAWALVDANRTVLAGLLAERIDKAAMQRNALATLMLLGVLGSIYLYVGIYLSIAAGLNEASTAARAIAAGDLGIVALSKSRDEFADLLIDMRKADHSLARLIAGVKSAAESIATASAEIADGTQDLSSRTEEASSTLQGTASSMLQLTGTVNQSTDAASAAIKLASSAANTAQQGGEVVTRVVTTMTDINTSSKRIGDIIGVIDGIAFQTNILALNAAVEAARAGEQGRGFAVVATEVRSLAKRSADAAREIKSLIGASLETVEAGAKLVSEAGATMANIVGSVNSVSDVIGAITAAAGAQGRGIVQVNVAVAELDQMTQQNAALVEQSAAAAESLKQQAGSLAEMVSTFRVQSRIDH